AGDDGRRAQLPALAARATGLPAHLSLRAHGSGTRPGVLGEARAVLRGVATRRVRLGGGRRQALTQPAQDVGPPVLIDIDVHRADAIEDLVGRLLLLITVRVRFDREGDRLAVLDRHLRELETPPA